MGAIQQKPIITIDDLEQAADSLHKSIQEFGTYKYPLALRKGVRNMGKSKPISKVLKAGAQTFFFDIKQTKQGKSYLLLTESRFKGEKEERERQSMAIFPEQAAEFAKAVAEMAAKIK